MSGWSKGKGSGVMTSSPAAAILPKVRASSRSSWLTRPVEKNFKLLFRDWASNNAFHPYMNVKGSNPCHDWSGLELPRNQVCLRSHLENLQKIAIMEIPLSWVIGVIGIELVFSPPHTHTWGQMEKSQFLCGTIVKELISPVRVQKLEPKKAVT